MDDEAETFTEARAAEPVELYAGRIEAIDAEDFAGPGKVSVEWIDGPQLRVEFLRHRTNRGRSWNHHFDAMPQGEGPWRLRLDDGREFAADMVQWDYRDEVVRSTGTPRTPEFGNGNAVTVLETDLVNLPLVNRDEVWLMDAGWRVHIHDSGDEGSDARSLGMYFVTGALSIERHGRRRFAAAEGEAFLDGLMSFLSLARGAWVGHLTLRGRNRVGRELWSKWTVAKADDSAKGSDWATVWYPRSRTGAGEGHESNPLFLAELWRGYSERWNRPDLSRTMKALTAMFIQGASHTDGEAGLVISHTVLELLSWLVVVNEKAMLSAEGHDRLTASDRIRLLLSVMGRDPSIPVRFDELAAAAREYRWLDGPQAVTELRNGLVHPIRREKLSKVSQDALEDARGLSLQYAEDALIYWLAPKAKDE